MDVGLTIAGLICVVLAAGHETIGVRWVLPGMTEERVPGTPVGPPAMTLTMVRVTWHIVTIFVLTLGGVLVTLANVDDGDAQMVLLRWFAGMWVAATAMVGFVTPLRRRNLLGLLRLPVPVLWLALAVLCWNAST